jgi:hypothetical protein
MVDPDEKTFGAVRLSEARALPSRQDDMMIAAMIFLFIS